MIGYKCQGKRAAKGNEMHAASPTMYYIFDSSDTLLWYGYATDERIVRDEAAIIAGYKKVETVIIASCNMDNRRREIVKTSRVRQTPINRY